MAWYDTALRCKPGKAVVRLSNDDGSYIASVNIPTVLWPLNAPYEVFHYGNCKPLEDAKVAQLVDAIPYRIGHCYSNAEAVTKALREHGYAARQYVGWLFVGKNQYPLHHSWTVLDGNNVLDLSDDYAILQINADKFNGLTIEETRVLMVAFRKWISQYPNSQRCMPFGTPSPGLLYIGCECGRQEGIDIYNNLVYRFPDHPCRERVNGNNKTKLQEMLEDAGL